MEQYVRIIKAVFQAGLHSANKKRKRDRIRRAFHSSWVEQDPGPLWRTGQFVASRLLTPTNMGSMWFYRLQERLTCAMRIDLLTLCFLHILQRGPERFTYFSVLWATEKTKGPPPFDLFRKKGSVQRGLLHNESPQWSDVNPQFIDFHERVESNCGKVPKSFPSGEPICFFL